MNDLSWLAPTIAALSALVVAVVGAIRSRENGRVIATVAADTAKVVEHTNGTLHAATAAKTAAESAKDVLLERVDRLERALAVSVESGALARAASIQAATDVRSAQAVTPPEEPAAE